MDSKQTKISEKVHHCSKFLSVLAKTKSEGKRRKLLKNADCCQLLAIVEISLNVCKARFKLTSRQKSRLLPHADTVRRLSRARSERGARSMVQKGSGAVGLFAALLTPILLEMAKNVIKGSPTADS